MAIERTLSIIKPDAVAKNVIGKIYSRFESNGLKIVAAKMAWLSPQEAGQFYGVHKERPFFKDLVAFMISGPVMIQVLEGESAIAKNRELMGATDPKKADAGTIRADFAESIDANAVHGSDAPETAAVEIGFLLPRHERLQRPLSNSRMTVNLLDFDAEGLTAWFAEQGEKPFRAKQVLRWIHRSGVADFDAMTDIAKSLREKLKAKAVVAPPTVVSDKLSDDGTRKFLIDVGNGNAVETVFIPEDDRGTLCISTQAGCALDCAFCSTGKQGFNRNLTVAEIIGQLWLANNAMGAVHGDERVISNVVLMGMGEPLANFENSVTALRLMLDDNAYGLSRRRVTVSTSGLVPVMDRLGDECPVALAVSLHAPNDKLRDQLVPINQKYPLKELMAACRRYLDKAPRDFITFEYIMLDGINDSDAHARELLALVKTVHCKFNLIPFNPFPGSPFRRSPAERVRRFADILMRAGIVTTTRKTRGDDIDAACGQLAGQVQDKTRRTAGRIIHLQEARP